MEAISHELHCEKRFDQITIFNFSMPLVTCHNLLLLSVIKFIYVYRLLRLIHIYSKNISLDRTCTEVPGSPGSANETSPYSPQAHKVDRYSFNSAPSEEMLQEIPDEMASMGSEDLSRNPLIPLAPALQLQWDGSETEDCGDETSVYTESGDEVLYENSEVSEAVFESAKLMQEVWARFDKDWTEKFITCAGSETTSVPPSIQKASTSAKTTVHKRQRRENDGDDDDDNSDDNGRAPKRSIPRHTRPDRDELKLSCPFRKHDPQRYKNCASYWKTVGRIK